MRSPRTRPAPSPAHTTPRPPPATGPLPDPLPSRAGRDQARRPELAPGRGGLHRPLGAHCPGRYSLVGPHPANGQHRDRRREFGLGHQVRDATRLGAWAEQVDALCPAGWVAAGGPIRTLRGPMGSRHVSHPPESGGFDLGVLVNGEDGVALVARHPRGRCPSGTALPPGWSRTCTLIATPPPAFMVYAPSPRSPRSTPAPAISTSSRCRGKAALGARRRAWPRSRTTATRPARSSCAARSAGAPGLVGAAEPPVSRFATSTGVADLAILIDTLGLHRSVIVGHDWGGWLALHLAQQNPEAVAGVVAAATAGPWLRGRPMLRHAWWYTTTIPFETPLHGR